MRPLLSFLLAFSLATSVPAVEIALTKIADGLAAPIAITSAGDGSGRLFITLQEGRIVVIRGGALLPEPFLDIRHLVGAGGERGLLSVSFHPRFAQNGHFFVDYTDRSGDTVIARYTVSPATPDRADPSTAKTILTVDQPFSNHNGGQLQFGPDGYLYIGMGDGGSGGDPENRAQNLSTLLGKLLRIDVDGGDPYAIPPDNPFIATSGARPEIWSYGLRNPWRFSFDRRTHDLFIADVGQNEWEEINVQAGGSRGGENWGWRLMEGMHCFDPLAGCNDGSLTLPVLEYGRSEGCSVSGGYRYRGSASPPLDGIYVYGDFCSGRIWGARANPNGTWTTELLLDTTFSISSFGEDEQGEIYVADISGAIYRITGPPQANSRRRVVKR
ncbi:MAG: PQQ-dependent sugar dehydrogenase [Acidobacteria bacterium]|nr:PQQ-dependent sugar dehydrogenase [Acidobacteriota bacterium]